MSKKYFFFFASIGLVSLLKEKLVYCYCDNKYVDTLSEFSQACRASFITRYFIRLR